MFIKRFVCEEGGQDLVEYALLVALAALAVLASLQALSATIAGIWTVIASRLAT